MSKRYKERHYYYSQMYGSKILNKNLWQLKHFLFIYLVNDLCTECDAIQIVSCRFVLAGILWCSEKDVWKALYTYLKHNMWSKPHANDMRTRIVWHQSRYTHYAKCNNKVEQYPALFKKKRYSVRHNNLFTLIFSKSKSFLIFSSWKIKM